MRWICWPLWSVVGVHCHWISTLKDQPHAQHHSHCVGDLTKATADTMVSQCDNKLRPWCIQRSFSLIAISTPWSCRNWPTRTQGIWLASSCQKICSVEFKAHADSTIYTSSKSCTYRWTTTGGWDQSSQGKDIMDALAKPTRLFHSFRTLGGALVGVAIVVPDWNSFEIQCQDKILKNIGEEAFAKRRSCDVVFTFLCAVISTSCWVG